MSIAGWWRRLRSRRHRSRHASREASEAGITARVDMVRFEALAEAAHEAMYEARLRGAKGCYEEARAHFAGATMWPGSITASFATLSRARALPGERTGYRPAGLGIRRAIATFQQAAAVQRDAFMRRFHPELDS